MSVAAIPSPVSRCSKRLYEVGDLDAAGYAEGGSVSGESPLHRQQKRTRLLHHQQQQQPHQYQQQHRSSSPAAGRCGFPQHHLPTLQNSEHSNALAALLGLFPGMDEKVVQDVLVECGNSIDAAIKRLTDLRLSSEDATVAAATAVASGAHSAAASAAAEMQQQQPGLALHRDAQQAAAAAAAASQGQGAVQGEAQQCSETSGPQTAEQWIDFLVAEMLASKDMPDARGRASLVLQHFERFAKERQKHETDARVAELLKENAIFKRAVQIQAARMQAKAAAEADELGALRSMVAQYQEQCRKLEVHNYSLAMHLQQATSSSGLGGGNNPRNPDVY